MGCWIYLSILFLRFRHEAEEQRVGVDILSILFLRFIVIAIIAIFTHRHKGAFNPLLEIRVLDGQVRPPAPASALSILFLRFQARVHRMLERGGILSILFLRFLLSDTLKKIRQMDFQSSS